MLSAVFYVCFVQYVLFTILDVHSFTLSVVFDDIRNRDVHSFTLSVVFDTICYTRCTQLYPLHGVWYYLLYSMYTALPSPWCLILFAILDVHSFTLYMVFDTICYTRCTQLYPLHGVWYYLVYDNFSDIFLRDMSYKYGNTCVMSSLPSYKTGHTNN